MTNVTPYSDLIQYEEARYGCATSQPLMQKIGGVFNFLTLNAGPYMHFYTPDVTGITMVTNGVGPLYYCFTDMMINNAMLYQQSQGTGGATTCDIKASSAAGAPFVSIFQTTPQINYVAPNYSFVTTGTPADFAALGYGRFAIIAPSASILTAGSLVRFDILGLQTSSTGNVGMVLQTAPTN